MMYSDFGWGYGFGWVFMILFWILFIWAILALIRGFKSGGNSDGNKKVSALDILNERYAKSEIDKKEYDEKKKDLIS